MNLSDYQIGTAYVYFNRADFKDESKFTDYCKFLCLPETEVAFVIQISSAQHLEFIGQNYVKENQYEDSV